jgi:NAD(P)-dependent dehydrogenase (short-subunit alcohol dehydrogenase family)
MGMGKKKVWFITGAGRGMGIDFAKAALADGHAVVATGRDTGRVTRALGQSDDLLAAKLDVASRADAEAAVRAANDRFGRIDVLRPASSPATSRSCPRSRWIGSWRRASLAR